jgi:hypothetical protein
MNNVVPLRTIPMTTGLLASAKALAGWHEDEGRSGSAIAIRSLVSEIERLREAAASQIVIVQQANASASVAQLKATCLLIVGEKLAPVIDEEIEQRQQGGNGEDWAPLQVLSNELHAAIRLAKG